MKHVGRFRFRLGKSTKLQFSDGHTVVQVSLRSTIFRTLVVLSAVLLIDMLAERFVFPHLPTTSANLESLVQACLFLLLVTPVLYLTFIKPLLTHVEERARAEEALRVSEERFRNVFHRSPTGIELYDENGHLLHANEACLKMFGITDEQDVVGLHLFEDPNTPPEVRIALRRGETVEYALHFDFERAKAQNHFATAKSGAAYLQVTASQIGLSETGSRFGYLIQIQDITERIKAEETIKASEANYRAIFDAASDAILLHDMDTGAILDANGRACDMFGYSRKVLRGCSAGDLSSGEAPYSDADAAGWMRRASKGRAQLFEWQSRDRSGRVFGTEVNLKKAVIGGQNRLLASIRDISERKRAEEAIAARAFWEGIAHTMQNGLLVLSPHGDITYANDSFCRLVGHDAADLVGGQPPYMWWGDHPTGESQHDVFIRDELRNHHGFVLHSTGEHIPVMVNVSNLRDAEGISISRVVVFQDISSLVAMEEQLVRKERLAMLGQLSGSIGHELRNPLGVIQSSVYYLRSRLSGEDEKITRHLDRLDNSVAFSDKVITDLLSFARIPRLYRHPLDMEGFIRHMLDEFAPHEGITVAVSSDGDPTASVDETQMTQLFRNLISNALDAMSDGGKLGIELRQTDDQLEITVRDTGAGIPAENLKKVFEPLYSTKARGAGFGLAICKKIVESHGGTTDIQSSPGDGTRVVVSLPVCKEDNDG
jgi:PAS domain S-box-containing protein